MRSLWPTSGASTAIGPGKILPLERRKAAGQCGKVSTRGVTPLAHQSLHLPGTGIEPRIISHDCLGQDDVEVGEPVAWPRQCAIRIVVEAARRSGRVDGPRVRHTLRTTLHRRFSTVGGRCTGQVQPHPDTSGRLLFLRHHKIVSCRRLTYRVPEYISVCARRGCGRASSRSARAGYPVACCAPRSCRAGGYGHRPRQRVPKR